MMKVIQYLTRQPRQIILAIAMLAVIFIGYVNRLAGLEMSASILYLLPVAVVSWCARKREGTFIALASSVSWSAAEWLAGRTYSHPLIFYWNLAVMFGFFLTVNFTLSGLKESLEKEQKLARVDALTGVLNVRYFYELADREIERSRRYGHPLTLLYLDCDNFKQVNDQFGHQSGNRLLRILAATLKNNTRGPDLVARLGGDEFAILMPETGKQITSRTLETLHKRMVDTLLEDGWPVTLSMGAAIYLKAPESLDEMIRSADRLMFMAKNKGKNRVNYRIFGQTELDLPSPESTPPGEPAPLV